MAKHKKKPKDPSKFTPHDIAKACGAVYGEPTAERARRAVLGIDRQPLLRPTPGAPVPVRHVVRSPMTMPAELMEQFRVAVEELSSNGKPPRMLSGELSSGNGILDKAVTSAEREVLAIYTEDWAVINRGSRVASNTESKFYDERRTSLAYSRMADVERKLPLGLLDLLSQFAKAMLSLAGDEETLINPIEIGKAIANTSDRNRASGAYVGSMTAIAKMLMKTYSEWHRNQRQAVKFDARLLANVL